LRLVVARIRKDDKERIEPLCLDEASNSFNRCRNKSELEQDTEIVDFWETRIVTGVKL
jgi:hypothetical protein